MNKIKRIYGKEKGKGKFRPMDYEKSCFVVNLFYASMFQAKDFVKLDAAVKFMNDNNPDMIFETRTFS